MTAIIIAVAWAVVGIALGIWRTKNFLRRLDEKFPNLPRSSIGWGEVPVIALWGFAWPIGILVDEPMTRSVLKDL